MLDFLIVLGQIPGTQYDLTFSNIIIGYSVVLTFYFLQREYKNRKCWLKRVGLIYRLEAIKPRRGRPKQRVVLIDRKGSTLRVNTAFLRSILHLAR